MNTFKFYLLFSPFAIFMLLLGACTPAETVSFAAGGGCPPGYHAVYDEQVGSAGTCQLNPNPPVTITVPANGICPPGYHRVYYLEFPQLDYCQLDPTPTPPANAQAPNLPPVLVTVTVPANGICPPGYHRVFAGGADFPQLDYCELDLTPTPPAQAPNSDIPNLKPAMEVVQYCANKEAKLGGVNISFPDDNTLHVDEWFSVSPSHVKCVDDLSNPRTCWGPQSSTFEVLLCTSNGVKNPIYGCNTLPVTLGACVQRPAGESDNKPDPIPPSCERDCR